jgi:hypothetical protein
MIRNYVQAALIPAAPVVACFFFLKNFRNRTLLLPLLSSSYRFMGPMEETNYELLTMNY